MNFDAVKIGEMIGEAYQRVPRHASVNAGGNLGMVFIAEAIAQHADAMLKLAAAIESTVRLPMLVHIPRSGEEIV